MKLAIFAAESIVGKQVIKQALYKEIDVTALVRNAFTSKWPENKNLQLIEGSLFETDDILKVINGVEAVIFCPSFTDQEGNKTRSLGCSKIIECMQKKSIKRLICLSGFGIVQHPQGKPWNEMPGYDKGDAIISAEYESMLNSLKKSDLDWTLLCAGPVVNEEATGSFSLNDEVDYLPSVNYNAGDVAMALLNCIQRKDALQQIKIIVPGKL